MHFSTTTLCLLAVLQQTISHSWPEALNLINEQGTIYGPTGYVRNFVPRNATGFAGDQNDSFQKTEVLQGAKTCMTRQIQQVQSPGYPRLAVTPASRVALRYAENGHVTIEQTGRPPQGGPVYIYGTTDGTDNPLLSDVMSWTADGSGGSKEGKLLATMNFDDGRCYELNNSPEEQKRAAANPLNGQLALPDFSGLPCQNDFVVPEDAPIGKPYTIYWVWNFTMVDPPGQGVEIYSDCLDFDVNPASNSSSSAADEAVAAGAQSFNVQQPPISAAVSTYFQTLAAEAAGSATPSAAAAAAAAAAPSATPSAESSPSAAASLNVVSEPATGGGVFAQPVSSVPASAAPSAAGSPSADGAAPATVTQFVTLQPSPAAMQTVYVTVGGSNAAPSQQPSAAQPSATGQQSATGQSPAAAQPSTAVAAQPSQQSANGLAIPIITLPSGAGSTPSASGANPSAAAATSGASAATPVQPNDAASSPSASAAASMPSSAPCKNKRAIKKSKLFANHPEVQKREQEYERQLSEWEQQELDSEAKSIAEQSRGMQNEVQKEKQPQEPNNRPHARSDVARFRRRVRA